MDVCEGSERVSICERCNANIKMETEIRERDVKDRCVRITCKD